MEAIYWYLSPKVNVAAPFWLHFIPDKISLRLLITDTSDFVKRWRMMFGRHSEYLSAKKVIGQGQ